MFGDLAVAIRNRKSSYFLGTIVLTGGDIPQVVDGQQRLATTAILLAAIRDYFYLNKEDLLYQSINHDFLYIVARELRDTVPRLMLNTVDNEFFKQRVLSLPTSAERSIQPSRPSHKLIEQAANIAKERIEQIITGQPSHRDKIDALNEWINFLENNATIIRLTAPDDQNAYKMFETLNDRGLRTSQADLLKNYLFGEADERLTEAQQKWSGMISSLQVLDVDDVVVTYLRHLASALHGLTREKEVYDRLQEKIAGPSRALEFLTQLSQFADDYVAILTPTSKKWNDFDPHIRSHIAVMQDLRVVQIRPLMLAVASRFQKVESEKAFRHFVFWSVRFLIAGGGRGGALEEAYAGAANQVISGEITDVKSLSNALKSIIPTDGEFEAAFQTARVSVPRLARYYLRALEAQANRSSDYPEVAPIEDTTVVNLEHILPQTPSPNWPHIDTETHEAYAKRIGNLILLNAKRNNLIDDSPFTEKVKEFQQSQISLTAQVASVWGKTGQWGPTQITERQQELAKLAVKTWPFVSR